MACYTYIIQEDGNIFKSDLMLCDPLAHLLGDGLDGAVVERHLQAGGLAQLGVAGRASTADEAQITSDLSAIWTQGTARLIDGENIFCSEAIYARPFEGQAYFFGTRCKLKRPGLAIDSDSIEYRWQDKIGVFDGHVLYIDSDGEKAFVHLEYDFNKNKIA